jgi:hypothetical protein
MEIIFGSLKRRRVRVELGEADADAFMENFWNRAYDEARERSRDQEHLPVLDGTGRREPRRSCGQFKAVK